MIATLSVNFEGKTYTLLEEALCENYKDTVRYFARATDSTGDHFNIAWEVLNDSEDESERCDWDNPIKVCQVDKT